MLMTMISKIGGSMVINKIVGKTIGGIKSMVLSKLMLSLHVVGLALEEEGLENGTAKTFTSLTNRQANENTFKVCCSLFFRLALLLYNCICLDLRSL